MSESEKRDWEEADPQDRFLILFNVIINREKNYIPQKYTCLRRVPLYISFYLILFTIPLFDTLISLKNAMIVA